MPWCSPTNFHHLVKEHSPQRLGRSIFIQRHARPILRFHPRFLLGGILGYLFVWSGNIWLPITAHFVNNAGAVIFTYLYQHGKTSIDPDAIGAQSDFGSVAMSIALGAALLYVIWKRESHNPPKQNYSVEETFK
ncbi:MAG: CPBP family intramembrane metalloprotease [Bacteroidetes bacterium]|nr:CPBP family intramembrane metalloprotease [Bacteroidota bacterium]